jgi:hypothetical protein
MINTPDIFSIGENASACTSAGRRRPECERWGQLLASSRSYTGAVEVSILRGIKRMEFPLSVRKKALMRCCRNGVPHCEGCGIEINARTGIIYEHDIPAGLGGEPTLENCKVRCKTCADIKTESEDKPRMAKVDRVLKKTYGLRKRRRTIPGRKFDDTPIPPRWVEA